MSTSSEGEYYEANVEIEKEKTARAEARALALENMLLLCGEDEVRGVEGYPAKLRALIDGLIVQRRCVASLTSAGKELLRLKSLHDAMERGEINDLTFKRDYDENKPLAWAALRAAVLGAQT